VRKGQKQKATGKKAPKNNIAATSHNLPLPYVEKPQEIITGSWGFFA